MKAIASVITSVLIMLTIIPGSKTVTSMKKNKIILNKSYYINEYDTNSLVDKLIAYPDYCKNSQEIIQIKKRLASISPDILRGLINSNVQIKLVDHRITDEPEYKNLRGVVPIGWEKTGRTWDDIPGIGGKPVVIRIGCSNMGRGHNSVNLELHETAHAIDKYVLNDISEGKEFKKMWKSEVNSLFGDNPYFVGNSEEYFAESYAMYYLNHQSKSKLKKDAPLTYEFIHSIKFDSINNIIMSKNI